VVHGHGPWNLVTKKYKNRTVINNIKYDWNRRRPSTRHNFITR